jgi:hypothetical protein
MFRVAQQASGCAPGALADGPEEEEEEKKKKKKLYGIYHCRVYSE